MERRIRNILLLIGFGISFLAGYVSPRNINPHIKINPFQREEYQREEYQQNVDYIKTTLGNCWPFAFYRCEDFQGPGGYKDWNGYKNLWDEKNPGKTIEDFNRGKVGAGTVVYVPDTNRDGKVCCKK